MDVGREALAKNVHAERGPGGAHENNYVFAPPSELPRVAQLLFETPAASATLVVPYWPAQAWFQQLLELATRVETHALASVAMLPAWLHGSARTALSVYEMNVRMALSWLGL